MIKRIQYLKRFLKKYAFSIILFTFVFSLLSFIFVNMKNIAIFASGSGTNAETIIQYFSSNDSVSVSRIFCNNAKAYVLTRAKNLNVPALVFNKKMFYDSDIVYDQLKNDKTDLIVLAGFLWLVPVNILKEYKNKIINIHPALLPKYGGKGMYGSKVHEAVLIAGEKESGITIHFVNEKYDEGKIVFQAKCAIDTSDTPDSLAAKIHKLEHKHYPPVIENILISL